MSRPTSGSKMHMVVLFTFLYLFFYVHASGPNHGKGKKDSKHQIKQDIRARLELFLTSWNADDLKTVASLYASDAWSMFTGEQTVYGRENIFNQFINAKKVVHTINVTVNEVFVINQKYAYHIEDWLAYDKNGELTVSNGRAMIVWKKKRDTWYMVRDMSNDAGTGHN